MNKSMSLKYGPVLLEAAREQQVLALPDERIFIKLTTSDRKLKASREGSA